jgi:hypothetical protein
MPDSSSPNERCAFDSTMRQRTPGRDIFGKLDDKLPEVRVPAEVKIAAERAAAELGLDLTVWLRELAYEALYGSDHVANLYRERMERVRGNARQREHIGLRVRDEMRSGS